MKKRSFIRRAAALCVASLAMVAAGNASAALKVAAIYTVPVEQQWVGRIHEALNEAVDAGQITYEYSENVANTDYERVMREYAEKGVDLIVGEAFAVERAARKVAAGYPDVAMLMGSSFGPEGPNFSVFDNYIHEPSYLSGMIAGSKTESNLIGMVGGFAIPEVNRLMNAFKAGAKSVNPDVKFLVTFINSWYDPPKAKESAFAMIDKGADLLYAERFGVTDAAVEREILAVGNVIDTASDYPGTVVASALWNMTATIQSAIAAVGDGSYEAADYSKYSYMTHDGGSVVFDAELVSEEMIAEVKAKQEAILSGDFVVEIDDNEPKSD